MAWGLCCPSNANMDEEDQLWSHIREDPLEAVSEAEDSTGHGFARATFKFFKFGLGDAVDWCVIAIQCTATSAALGGCSVFWHVRDVFTGLAGATS